MLFNAIAYLAEEADHHPDITASYASLEIRLMTHSAGGITDKDFNLAGRIEALAGAI
jgi:4a-hydroxytetrahydrobiopterin dehydratase